MPAELSKLTSRQAVLDAIEESDQMGRDRFLEHYGYRRSRLYPLKHNGGIYDSKAIVGVAYGKQHGEALKYSDFSGGSKRVLPILHSLGFDVAPANHPAEDLEVGTKYFRTDLRDWFGGQLQSGIWTPKEFPVVFLFSGESGQQFGYEDGWTDDGLFEYTGEGQTGDMTFKGGNAAIRDHHDNGEDLLLFEDLGKNKGVRYLGLFDCAGWDQREGVDVNGQPRKLLVFFLAPVRSNSDSNRNDALPSTATNRSLEQLRQMALDAANDGGNKKRTGKSKSSWYERSERVREYVLRRADGKCEACDEPAPFAKNDGQPYLEPHHTKRLADEGPDHPAWVGAICPNCHRRIHYGVDGLEWNKKLQARLQQKELDV